MSEDTRIPKRKWALNIAYIIVIIILAVLAIGGSFITRRSEYVAGTRNDVHYSAAYGFGLSVISTLITLPIAAGASLLALISLILRHRNTGQIILKLALIFLGPAIVVFAFFYSTPLSPVFLKGFEQWVLQETDIDAIQSWLADEGAKHAGQHYTAEEGFPEELPACLVKLKPRFISFSHSTSQSGPNVEIVWFMVMDEYGLIVGSPKMETPKTGRIKLDSAYYEFRRPVKPGAYVFIRG